MSKLKAVLFDLDGVLVDSHYLHYRSWDMLATDLSLNFTQKQGDARDRALILDSLVDGLSYDELAGKYQIAYESVRDVMRKGKAALDRHY